MSPAARRASLTLVQSDIASVAVTNAELESPDHSDEMHSRVVGAAQYNIIASHKYLNELILQEFWTSAEGKGRSGLRFGSVHDYFGSTLSKLSGLRRQGLHLPGDVFLL